MLCLAAHLDRVRTEWSDITLQPFTDDVLYGVGDNNLSFLRDVSLNPDHSDGGGKSLLVGANGSARGHFQPYCIDRVKKSLILCGMNYVLIT